MVLSPKSVVELTSHLSEAHAGGEPVRSWDLTALNRLIEHKPEDMTATAESGLTLGEFQRRLAANGQWLPIDPPGADQLTLGTLLDTDASGPRRFGYGTIRDYLIGIKVVSAQGKLICAGGKVVKNVAGYDLPKLFIGSRGSLGIIVEATFKLRPLPETESFVQAQFASLNDAGHVLEAVLDSGVMPVVLDLFNLVGVSGPFTLAIGFAGTGLDVKWQLERVAALGVTQPATLDYERVFWNGAVSVQTPDATGIAPEVHKISVLPSKVVETLHSISDPFVARAGNGVIYHRGKAITQAPEAVSTLGLRLKETWDPKNILPPPPL